MAGKEAIIFIIDANHSMSVPYNNAALSKSDDPSSVSRLSAVKDAVLQKIITMAWQSSTHEFGVVILKTEHTHHHLHSTNATNISKFFIGGRKKYESLDEDIPFPNLIEIDLTRPSHHMLNTIQSICATDKMVQTSEADFCQSLILAADTLYRRTSGKKYKRRIILFTDAEHEVEVDGERLECVLDGLKKMDVTLEVVGLGFQEEGVFVKREDCVDEASMDVLEDEIRIQENDDDHDVASMCRDEELSTKIEREEENAAAMDNDAQDLRMLIKRENEKLLLSLAQLTGGCVIAANGQDITPLLESYHARSSCVTGRISTRSKCEFKITPNLTIETRYAKLIDQKSVPSLKTDAYLLDEITGRPLKDGGGEFMTTPIDSIFYHTLPKNPDNLDEGIMEVPQESRTDAYRFGSDLIPIGKMDMAGINSAFKSPKSIEMIGYVKSKDVIQSGFTLGPAYALFGERESKKSMTAVAALAEAMANKSLWGYCRFVKSPNGDPKLATLVPKQLENKSQSSTETSRGWYFALLQLPFSDDVNFLKPHEVPLDHWGDNKECNICDNLIDSLMIPDGELESPAVPLPSLNSYRRMVSHFSMNPITDEQEMMEGLSEERIIKACHPVPICELEELEALSNKASKEINLFLKTFPLTKNANEGKKPEKKYWGDGN